MTYYMSMLVYVTLGYVIEGHEFTSINLTQLDDHATDIMT